MLNGGAISHTMKILIIDDSQLFRKLIRKYLARELKQAEVVEYDVEQLGKPKDNFNWSQYDVLILDYNLGGGEDGLKWLEEFGSRPGFPRTIMLTGEGDVYVAVQAMKLGAIDFINKKDMAEMRLAEIVVKAAQYTTHKQALQDKYIDDATQIIRNIHNKDELLVADLDIGYKFIRMIGEGGMSMVYLAEREVDKQSLVIKILDLGKVHDEILIQRFRQEAELIANLNSPFIINIYEHGFTNEYGFIAMEFCTRGDLQHRMELEITPEIAINYMTHIAYGLNDIHEIGVVHRDLKPANIMFRSDDRLVIADFGISKILDDSNTALTQAGEIFGTPHYMSPEQGEGDFVDIKSDIYSAGIILFELLAGNKPYIARSAASIIYKHINATIPRLPDNVSQYQEIIDKSMAKKPEDRYQNAAEFIEVLESAETNFK